MKTSMFGYTFSPIKRNDIEKRALRKRSALESVGFLVVRR